jgi:hypothetical protein
MSLVPKGFVQADSSALEMNKVFSSVQRTWKLLLECGKLLEKDEDVHRMAEAQLVKFEGWASKSGVLALGHSSLDHRLRFTEAERAILEGNLKILCRQALGGMTF